MSKRAQLDSRTGSVSRRSFMKSAALLSAGAVLPFRQARGNTRTGNVLPGRIAIWEDVEAT